MRNQPSALAVMLEGLLELEAAGADDLSMCSGHLMASMTAANVPDVVAARAHAEETLQYARRTGMPSLLAMASFVRGESLALTDPSAARASFDESVAVARSGASDMVLSPALAQIGRLAAATGDRAGATAALREAVMQAHDAGYRPSVIGALQLCVVGFASLELDEPAAVIAGVVSEGPLADLNYRFDSMAAQQRAALEGVRLRIGDDRHERALRYGSELTYEEVIQYARQLFNNLEAESSDATPSTQHASGTA
jgi:hypothetical protein